MSYERCFGKVLMISCNYAKYKWLFFLDFLGIFVNIGSKVKYLVSHGLHEPAEIPCPRVGSNEQLKELERSGKQFSKHLISGDLKHLKNWILLLLSRRDICFIIGCFLIYSLAIYTCSSTVIYIYY